MISFLDSQKIIKEVAGALAPSTEKIALRNLENRILAEDIFSAENIPSFDNSLMDGFAVNSSETPGKFIVGEALEIMTGAPMPIDKKYDAVARVEDCKKITEGDKCFIEIEVKLTARENVRFAGTDMRKGDRVLSKGIRLNTSHIMALASIGKSHIQVYKKPRIAVLSTGSELVDFSVEELPQGKIRNSSQAYIMNTLEAMGCEAVSFGILRDDTEKFKKFLFEVEKGFDLVITTGAVSMGKYDFVREILEEQGGEVFFHRVAVRPGKPILFAKLKTGCAFFGLPGNPISSVFGLQFFLKTFFQAMFGMLPGPQVFALNTEEKAKPSGLTCFFRARATVGDDAVLRVKIHPNQASNAVSPQIESNAWTILPEQMESVAKGARVQVVLNGELS